MDYILGSLRKMKGKQVSHNSVPVTRLTVDEVDRLAWERPPYPHPSANWQERCMGLTQWHRPQVNDWNAGNRESVCTWCWSAIERRFADGVWRATGGNNGTKPLGVSDGRR